ncbi:vacuolar protein sorting-associated protein 37D-like [Trachinotus anak]|uniref:vacuolar protein sorting-associated protein 37D-like n=1 Tax=Trachinotus anak TaxID=443729 RepID=UPI0039F1756F
MSLLEQFFQFGVFRTRELRELLEDEDKLNHLIKCSERFQGLQRAAEKILISNQKLAKVSLSQKPKFRDARLLLAMKYKEMEKLRNLIQAKQEQLAEKYSVHYAQSCLLKMINRAEEECELLFQRFAEGKTPLPDFLESFLSSRKLHHIRLILVKKLQEIIQHREKTTQRLDEIHSEAQDFSLGFPEQIHNPCRPICSLATVLVLPSCCHPPFLPFGDHGHSAQYLPHLPFCFNYDESLRPAVRGRGPRWPTTPVRLQPLKVQQRRDKQAPQ